MIGAGLQVFVKMQSLLLKQVHANSMQRILMVDFMVNPD
jgi:hypothetical protein